MIFDKEIEELKNFGETQKKISYEILKNLMEIKNILKKIEEKYDN